MKHKTLIRLLALFILPLLAACQDHHFVPYDKLGPLDAPKPLTGEQKKEASQQAQKASQQAPQAPGQQAYGAPPAMDAGEIVSGTIELSPSAGKPETGWILYVIVRPVEGGPPLAAKRLDKAGFPVEFSVTTRDAMMGEVKPGMPVSVEAVYDSDGDPITKNPKDLFGKSKDAVKAGPGKAVIVLDRRGKGST